MKTFTLKVKVGFSPEVLAKACREHGESCGNIIFGITACPFAGAACPLTGNDKACKYVTAEDWAEVLQDEEPEPEPEFHFGDKVTHYIDFPVSAVFSAYKDSRHSGEAYVLFDGSPECEVVFARNLKAGWE